MDTNEVGIIIIIITLKHVHEFYKNARIGNAVKNGKIYWDRYIYWSRNGHYIDNILMLEDAVYLVD